MDKEISKIAEYMGEGNNFYAPYYRHMTIENWATLNEDTINNRFHAVAMKDVQQAFNIFLSHRKPERPFVLAGFSQGGKAVVELLKSMPDSLHRYLVAAYVLGYKVTPDDQLATTNIQAAQGATDTGVTICYNSVASPQAICPALSPSQICINPVNWHTDATPAQLNDSVSVRVDTTHKVLLVEGLDESQYYAPSLGQLFKPGNYHLQELLFYQEQLRHNSALRTESFLETAAD